MRFIILLLIAPFYFAFAEAKRAAIAPPPAADVRALSDPELKALTQKLAAKLKKCKELKHGADIEATLANKTSEFIDPSIVKDGLKDALKLGAATGPGKKYEVRAELESRAKETGNHFEGTYTLSADVIQAEEKLCSKSETLKKSGEVKK